jgi:NAD(P)-dependent dehydrogenase (short-subunit alcohol dehydrogenase family)
MMREINERIQLDSHNTPTLFKRNANPSEVAALIGFLLRDESKYMTAADYQIDGGHCA